MRSKIFYGIFAVAMMVFLLSLILVLTVVYGNFSQRHAAELLNETYYLASVLEIGDAGFLDTLPERMSNSITYINADGEVILDNFADENDAKNYFALEEFIEANEKGIGESSRYSVARGARMAHCTAKLSDGSYLRVSSTQYTIMTLIVDLLSPIIIIIAASILLSLFLAARISSSITKPINELDLDALDARDLYPELQPFINKIHEQNIEIDKQMKELRSEHEMKDSFRREFTANVSHELKTPLTTISGAAELMSAGFVKNEDIPRFAENIYSEAQRLITLVNDIMELSRLDENAIPEKKPLDLYLLADETVKRLSKTAQGKNVQLILEGKSTVMLGVLQIINEIIYNLCDNAIKYNKENGSVTVTVDDDLGKPYISVKDTGIGIPEDEMGRVFERFYRVDKSHSGERSGTGLGLSIVKHGAMIHNGKITIKSKLGEGTEIKVSFA